jgi:hypothetical protein
VTHEPADIYGIAAADGIGYVYVKVVPKDGVSPGARNVGKLVFDTDADTWAMIPVFNITGTLGTLGVESHVSCIMGLFSVAELGEPFSVDWSIAAGGHLAVTGTGPHSADLYVKSVWGAGDPNDVQIDISGDYLGTLTLGAPS